MPSLTATYAMETVIRTNIDYSLLGSIKIFIPNLH